ncbi:YciI family protein [Conexibacter sp. SYSU D00693]|uniref:YciI family protein n=1 Tax=Conexibacter sp. SYSU D00693 TaxID=2812560 RepID=UPI00196B6146|nr:YciI family protein [Conexibacter sp. SYSU D00693]
MERLAALHYTYVEDVLERREPHREAHLAILRELKDAGELVMAGPVGDPPAGALIVFRSPEAAQAFVARDPYVEAGIVTSHRIEVWTIAV